MALIFHSGFEAGDFSEWAGSYGAVSIQGATKKTGDYAMRCNPSGAVAVNAVHSGNLPKRTSVYMRIASAPDIETPIMGSPGSGASVWLTPDRYLKLYDTITLKDTGSTQLALNTWYRISLSGDFANDSVKAYLNRVEECSSTDMPTSIDIAGIIGCGLLVTTDLYFDDYIEDDTESTDDIGDIRVLRAVPIADSSVHDDWAGVPDGIDKYKNVDEVPADDGDYNWFEANGVQNEQTHMVTACLTLGLKTLDEIKAVAARFRYKTGGGGVGDYATLVRDNGVDYLDWALIDHDFASWIDRYYAVMPNGGEAWTQERFDAFEVGMVTKDARRDMWCYTLYVMVAYKVASAMPSEQNLAIKMVAANAL